MMRHSGHTLLAVFAHPDDESFGIGGTLAYYASQGAAVHLICATRGEAGTVQPEHLQGFSSIGELREAELRCAASNLGLASVTFLDYRDSGMSGSVDNQHPEAFIRAPIEEVAQRIALVVRRVRPQVVVTFDPIGGYKHPDHIHIHHATNRAFDLAGDAEFLSDAPAFQPERLYYSVFSKNLLKLLVRVMPLMGKDPRRLGRNQDIDLAAVAKDGDFPVHTFVRHNTVAPQRENASACHASQLAGGLANRGILGWVRRLFPAEDTFMRARPPAPRSLREHDLFEGL
jgi:LmbE family N-acetylglucosaminyl deacetylase